MEREGNRENHLHVLPLPSLPQAFLSSKNTLTWPGSESCKPSQSVPNDIYVMLRRANCPEHQYKLHLKPNAQLLCYLWYLVTSITLLLLLLCDFCYFVTSVALFLQLLCYFCYLVSSVTLLLLLPCFFSYFVTSVTLLLLLPYITSVTLLIACRPVVIVTQHIPTFRDRDQRDKTIALS